MERTVKTKSKARKDNELVNDGDKAWVTLSQSINLGNYESLKIEMGYSETIKNEDISIEVVRDIEEELEGLLAEKVNQINQTEDPKRKRKKV